MERYTQLRDTEDDSTKTFGLKSLHIAQNRLFSSSSKTLSSITANEPPKQGRIYRKRKEDLILQKQYLPHMARTDYCAYKQKQVEKNITSALLRANL